MTYCRAVASMMLFILMFEQSYAKKDFMDYGPMKDETGRYLYQPSFGDPKYCRYCPLEAVLNSEYDDAQQHKCLEKYQGKNIAEEILPQKKASKKYQFCDEGDVPRCGPPPEENKTKNHEWVCDPGYSFVNYSVYSKCALVCNITKRLDWQYYCNELLQWEVQPASVWQKCEGTGKLVILVPIIGGAVVAICVFLTCIIYYHRRKRANSRENIAIRSNDVIPEIIERDEEGVRSNDVIPEIFEVDEEGVEPVGPESDLGDGSQSGSRSPSRTGSLSCSRTKSDSEDDDDNADDENTKLIMPHPSVKPTVSIIQFEGGERKKIIPWQGDIYSIERGSDFQIIPSSTGGYEVTKFMIEGKDNSCIRWEKYFHWYTVNNASDRDAGLYMWKMMLNNKYEHCGSFEISIALPAIRPMPIGKEASNKDTSSLKTVNPVYSQPQQPSSTSHLKFDSILNNPNDQDVIEDNELLPQGNLVRGEVVKETRGNADPFRHAADLSSEMFRDHSHRNTIDSGVQSSNEHRSSSSSNIASDRTVSQRNNSNDNTRDGDLRYSTSGYQMQTIASLARDQFGAIFEDAPPLSIGSLNKRSKELSTGLEMTQALHKRGYLNPSEDRNEDTGARGGEYTGTRAGEYTGTRAGEYTGTRAGEYTGARVGEYTGARAGEYTGARVGEYTGTRGGEYTGASVGEYTGARGGEYTGTRAGEYTGARVGEYTGARGGEYTGTRAGEYTGARVGEYTGTRAGKYTGARVGEYTGTRAGEYTGTRAGEYTGTRAGEYIGARVDEDSGARADEYAGARAGEYTRARGDQDTGTREDQGTVVGEYKVTGAGADQNAGAKADEYAGARADQDNGAMIRPDPAGSVSPMNHSEGSGSLQETFRKQLYVPDTGTQQETIVDHHHDTAADDDDDIGDAIADDIAHDNGDAHDNSDDDVDSISERLNSVALQNDILGDGRVYGVEEDLEHTYPEGEIQHLPYRHDSVLVFTLMTILIVNILYEIFQL